MKKTAIFLAAMSVLSQIAYASPSYTYKKKVGVTVVGSAPAASGAMTPGNGVPIGSVLAQTNADFGTVYVGSSESRSFTYTNSGSATADSLYASVSGTGMSIVSSTCGTAASHVAVPVNGSCSVVVQYVPSIAGSASGTLSFTGAHSGAAASVSLSGSSILRSKHIEASTGTVDFGSIDVGASKTLQVQFLNTGNDSVGLNAINLTGTEFSVTPNCPSALPSTGSSCYVDLTYHPSVFGAAVGALNVNTDALEGTLAITLKGTGLQGVASLVATTDANFGEVLTGSSATKTFTLSNTGNKAISGIYPTLVGTGLSFSFNSCGTQAAPVSLAAGGSCTVSVSYSPTVASVLSSASLSIASKSTSLIGSGVAPAGGIAAQTTTDFGAVSIGASASKVFTYTNSGSADATSVKAAVTGTNLSISATTCGTQASPVTIPKNGTCSITVQYAPTALGSLTSAAVSITGAHSGASATLALSGSAQEAPPLASNYVLLLHADGANGAKTTASLVDSSPSPISPTYLGPVVNLDTSTAKFGTASLRVYNAFNDPSWGAGYVQYPVQYGGVRRFSMGSGDFTIDSFIKPSGYGCYGAPFFSYENVDTTNSVITPSWEVAATKTGQLMFSVYNDNGTTAFRLTSTATIPTGSWSHIGVSRKAGAVKLFIDGTQVASGTYTGGMELTRFYSDIPFVIGRPIGGGSGCNSGIINYDEVRVLKGYGVSSMTVPTAPYTP